MRTCSHTRPLTEQIVASAVTPADVRGGSIGLTGAELVERIRRWRAEGVPAFLQSGDDSPELARQLRERAQRPNPWSL